MSAEEEIRELENGLQARDYPSLDDGRPSGTLEPVTAPVLYRRAGNIELRTGGESITFEVFNIGTVPLVFHGINAEPAEAGGIFEVVLESRERTGAVERLAFRLAARGKGASAVAFFREHRRMDLTIRSNAVNSGWFRVPVVLIAPDVEVAPESVDFGDLGYYGEAELAIDLADGTGLSARIPRLDPDARYPVDASPRRGRVLRIGIDDGIVDVEVTGDDAAQVKGAFRHLLFRQCRTATVTNRGPLVCRLTFPADPGSPLRIRPAVLTLRREESAQVEVLIDRKKLPPGTACDVMVKPQVELQTKSGWIPWDESEFRPAFRVQARSVIIGDILTPRSPELDLSKIDTVLRPAIISLECEARARTLPTRFGLSPVVTSAAGTPAELARLVSSAELDLQRPAEGDLPLRIAIDIGAYLRGFPKPGNLVLDTGSWMANHRVHLLRVIGVPRAIIPRWTSVRTTVAANQDLRLALDLLVPGISSPRWSLSGVSQRPAAAAAGNVKAALEERDDRSPIFPAVSQSEWLGADLDRRIESPWHRLILEHPAMAIAGRKVLVAEIRESRSGRREYLEFACDVIPEELEIKAAVLMATASAPSTLAITVKNWSDHHIRVRAVSLHHRKRSLVETPIPVQALGPGLQVPLSLTLPILPDLPRSGILLRLWTDALGSPALPFEGLTVSSRIE